MSIYDSIPNDIRLKATQQRLLGLVIFSGISGTIGTTEAFDVK